MKYSSFGACYFIEVKGDFEEDSTLNKIATPAIKFDWNI